MDIDDLLEEAGGFGKYQKIMCCLLGCMVANIYMNIVGTIFLLAVPEFRCNETVDDNGMSSENYTFFTKNHSLHCFKTEDNVTTNCQEWVYNRKDFDETLVTQFNWVCDRAGYRSYAMMTMMIGMLVGSFCGPIGDIIGRKRTIFALLSVTTVVGLFMQMTSGFYSYIAGESIIFIANVPLLSSAYALGNECLIKRKRKMININAAILGSSSFLLLDGVAYFSRHWRYIHLALTVPSGLLLFSWWFLVESPRWLLTRGRPYDAENSLKSIARVNGTTFPNDIIDTVSINTGVTSPAADKLWHVFRCPVLAINTVTLGFIWVILCLTFYGLSFTAGNLFGNLFVNSALLALAEYPATLTVLFFVNRLGRKLVFMAGIIGAGLLCLLSLLPSLIYIQASPLVVNIMLTIGKCGGSISFTVGYIYTMEFFPTSIRTTAMSMCILFGRIGCIIAPYVANITDFLHGRTGDIVRRVIFGGFALLAGSMCLTLPETAGKTLPETIEDCIDRNRFKLKSNSGPSKQNKDIDSSDIHTHA